MAKRKAGSKAKKTAARRSAPRRAGSTKKNRKSAKASRPSRTRKAARPKKATRKAARPVARRASTAKKPALKKRPSARAARPKPAALQRERRRLAEGAITPSVPSTLNFSRKASAASSGGDAMRHQRREHTEAGPEFTGGDIDADWEDGYSEGDEAPGGDNPTPDQDVVEEIGRALGVEYEDGEELKGADKITERDTNRWEYDPASAEDYKDRNKKE
jgi:hypothetical protein